MTPPKRNYTCSFALIYAAHVAFAQAPDPAANQPSFEVASVKPAAQGGRGMFMRPGPNGGVDIRNMTLKELVVMAWRVQPFQISGGPSWIESARYDITAKPETRTNRDEIALMLRSLLEERFQLKIHQETKDLPIYVLVMARKDGKLGPNLVPSKEAACPAREKSNPPAPPEPGKFPAMGCGQMAAQPSRLRAVAVPVGQIVNILSRFLGRSVVDRTGLTGNYDIDLQWAPDENQMALMPPPPDGPKPPPQDLTGPSIFTALQEQLGLKLESQKAPVETIVIDSVERPSEN